jgi:CheY-like chemotaxis protein/glycine cleavage system H lipoate-binding protein
MIVTSIIVTTIIVFILVDLLLRVLLTRYRTAQVRRERERALSVGLKLDVSEEAPTLKRVELAEPQARILAVDDEPVVLDSLRKMLALGGYSIDTVESGPEVLGLIRKRDYDFVFTDLKMPGMDGVEVTKAVRHMRPDIDVAVITGYATIETAVETVRLGAMDYIEKPFTEDELLEFVREAVIKRQDRLERQVRHRLRVVRPGTGESKSRFELNVPAGAFVSPQHAWLRIELNGAVRIGLDDLMRKVFSDIDSVDLPAVGWKVKRGDPLFSVTYGDFSLNIPSPVSGKVLSVNTEQAEHPEWLAAKPFELSWICRLEPSNLSAELPDLRIGTDAIEWYRQELERCSRLANGEAAPPEEPVPAAQSTAPPLPRGQQSALLARFTNTFSQPGG